jgi:cytochrome c peroxidase
MRTYLFASVISLMACFFSRFNPQQKTPEQTVAKLGEKLFFDPILSLDNSISCASCHQPAHAFADTVALSNGFQKRKGTRNTPTVMNLGQTELFFWDGRVKTLARQALEPIQNVAEMNLPITMALARLQKDSTYSALFFSIFNRKVNADDLGTALATFQQSLETSDSPFDEWKFSEDSNSVSAEVKSGFDLFNGKAKCVRCHFGADLTTREFRNIGLFDAKRLSDTGRMLVTGNMNDLGKFKTPTLRNVAITAPYMHDGRFKTLQEVVEFYDDPEKIIPNAINRDTILARPLGLTTTEKKALVQFLEALTDRRFNKK